MASSKYQYYPSAPGPKNPGKYPVTPGPNYNKWGEQQGWNYNPYTDKYTPDPKAVHDLGVEQGTVKDPPKQPGLGQTLLPIAGALGAVEIGKELGSSVGTKVGGLINPPTVPATTVTTGNTGLAGANAPAPTPGAGAAPGGAAGGQSTGMLGTGGAASAPVEVTSIPAGEPIPPGYTAVGVPSADGSTLIAPTPEGGAAPPTTGTNYGAIAQGAGGALQLYSAYNQYKAGDKLGAGITGLAGAGNVAQAAGVTSVAPYVPYANIASGAYGLYKGVQSGSRTGSAFGGAQAGAGIGTLVAPGVGTLVGAGIGAVAGGLLGHAHTGKSQAQQARDDMRGGLQAGGLADNNYNVTLADGSTYNIGVDGKTKLTNVGKNIDGGTTRHPYDVDFSNPLAQGAVGRINNLLGAGANPQMVGMLVNAVTSNAKTQQDVDANIAALEAKAKKNPAPANAAPAQSAPAPTSTSTAPVPGTNKYPRGLLGSAQGTGQGAAPVVPNGAAAQPSGMMMHRTYTKSPGIGMDGKPIFVRR